MGEEGSSSLVVGRPATTRSSRPSTSASAGEIDPARHPIAYWIDIHRSPPRGSYLHATGHLSPGSYDKRYCKRFLAVGSPVREHVRVYEEGLGLPGAQHEFLNLQLFIVRQEPGDVREALVKRLHISRLDSHEWSRQPDNPKHKWPPQQWGFNNLENGRGH